MDETNCSNCMLLILILSDLELRSCFEPIRIEFDMDGLQTIRSQKTSLEHSSTPPVKLMTIGQCLCKKCKGLC